MARSVPADSDPHPPPYPLWKRVIFVLFGLGMVVHGIVQIVDGHVEVRLGGTHSRIYYLEGAITYLYGGGTLAFGGGIAVLEALNRMPRAVAVVMFGGMFACLGVLVYVALIR